MNDHDIATRTTPCLALHLEGCTNGPVNEKLYECLVAADNAFGYGE